MHSNPVSAGALCVIAFVLVCQLLNPTGPHVVDQLKALVDQATASNTALSAVSTAVSVHAVTTSKAIGEHAMNVIANAPRTVETSSPCDATPGSAVKAEATAPALSSTPATHHAVRRSTTTKAPAEKP